MVDRAGRLPTPSLLHIPLSCRPHMATMLAAILDACVLEMPRGERCMRVFFRLTCQAVPQGVAPASEMADRLGLWAEGNLDALATRVENQRGDAQAGHMSRTEEEKQKLKHPAELTLVVVAI